MSSIMGLMLVELHLKFSSACHALSFVGASSRICVGCPIEEGNILAMVNIATGTNECERRAKRDDQLDPTETESNFSCYLSVVKRPLFGRSLSLRSTRGHLRTRLECVTRFLPLPAGSREGPGEFYRLTNWNCIVDIFVCLFAPSLNASAAPKSVLSRSST